ncbi:hypothetical protein AMS68_005073 [Peltaster fructicola]|uniref:NEDD8-activating enzyme E1 regulatory subunit n=1 Tax=Peltaster fructicola TaxID=286661 RepID=A0A6H0XY02_9PEZI|nr:hypothetical protein AMS68_005073 [Peltaster fructicola]
MTDNTQTSTPPPLQVLPTAKERKYDRQLRLWGATGQVALEESHVLLVNSGTGVTGIETLKNLVLPGVGNFTVQDSHIVTEADLGVNFFLDDESLGKFRATETMRLLKELNPDVRGSAIIEPIETLVTTRDAFASYTLILVAAPVDPNILAIIQEHAIRTNTPLFYFHCVGFYSHFSVQLPLAFPIVDTHPDPTSTEDLRLLKPWPQLSQFADQMTAKSGMTDHEKGHLPYIVILLRVIERWKEEHGGNAPESYKDKVALRNLVREEGGDEENYQEAYNTVLKSLVPPTLPSAVREILTAPEATDLSVNTASFWVIAHAVRLFYEKHAVLPLPGSVPDMKAQSSDYIQLQKIYKDKARADAAEVLSNVRTLEKQLGRAKTIETAEVENFCKGAAQIHLVRGRPFPVAQAGQKLQFKDRAKALASRLTDPDSLLGLYLAFQAFDEFAASHATPITTSADSTDQSSIRVPGSSDLELEGDEDKLTGIAHKFLDALLNEAGTSIDDPEYSELKDALGKICVELTRAGGAELHNIASLTGGMIAQEVVKVVTAQYVPVDNTCVFDGIESKSSVLRI